MKIKNMVLLALTSTFLGSGILAASADNVKVTPLGGQTGEFCKLDRAMIFEDPDGTRVLYDPGMTVAGANDPRLGKVDAILVSHMHFDHVGGKHNAELDLADMWALQPVTYCGSLTVLLPIFLVIRA